ncbi:MAG: sel1 repeat family protein [Magnetococcales bacterium]|nr:sel1 repeat family protein [Magnetococcales bacterium]
MQTKPTPEAYLHLLQTLAEQGNPKAQYNLGAMLLHGQGVARDDAAAAQWLRKAAEQGIPLAQHNLAVMLLQGQGVSRDPGEAARWFLAAARQGEPRSQHTLGALYYEGLGVEQDVSQAYFWLCLSITHTPAEFQSEAQAIQAHISSQLSPEEQAKIQRQVAGWQPYPHGTPDNRR